MEILRDKIKGAVIGHAIGDALGMPLEGVLPHERKIRFPSEIIKYLDPIESSLSKNNKKGMYTDDTQLFLATAQSFQEKGEYDPQDLAKKYVALKGKNKETMILRAPGWSTIYGIDKLRKKIIETKETPWNYGDCGRETGEGSGSISRTLPYHLFFPENSKKEELKELVNMTHKNDVSFANAQAAHQILKYILHNEITEQKDGFKIINKLKEHDDIRTHHSDYVLQLEKAIYEARDYKKNLFGENAKGATILYNGLYAFLTQPKNFLKATSLAVENYDSDSVGSITGTFAGANNGLQNIPLYLINQLENYKKIIEIGDNLATHYMSKDSKHSGGR